MRLRVVLIKPSKYAVDGFVDRFRRGIMPNSTLPYLRSLTPERLRGVPVEVHAVDEYVCTDLDYLSLLQREPGVRTLVALVGVQSHQLHRALDLAAMAVEGGCLAVLGGPHPMTCDTAPIQGRGVSVALAEAERIWPSILEDAACGELRPVYGADRRWEADLAPPPIRPPNRRDLRRYVLPMLGLYPSRGCPFRCNFCSVIKIAGRRIRSQPLETTMASLEAAEAAGVRMIMFTSDNFNKIPGVDTLLEEMIRRRLRILFFAQCDSQIAEQPQLVSLLGRAGCFQMFVGVESFSRATLLGAHKSHNRPERYARIAELCRRHGITSHFSTILGFPTDTEASLERQLEELCRIDPNAASFHILCPIPGTEQYDEFRSQGLIFERNLDRFDATCLTWSHPSLSASRMERLLFRCYERFYGPRHALSTLRGLYPRRGEFGVRALSTAGNLLFARYSAWKRRHPMSGGIGRIARDAASDYLPLRQRRFGFDRVPLPKSLSLSEPDETLNRVLNPHLLDVPR